LTAEGGATRILVSSQPQFLLVRILGNDLPPRHTRGQTLANLQFILRHETAWPGTARHWIVNRIWDHSEERAICQILDSHEESYSVIPFTTEAYAEKPWDYTGLPGGSYLSGECHKLTKNQQRRAEIHACRHRANYAINNNGARVVALSYGRDGAEWIMPWDGNCFLTPSAWTQIESAAKVAPDARYLIVPMARVAHNHLLLDADFRPKATDEPQIAFRHTAHEKFNLEIPYGRRPKVELLWRLGVAGPWDSFIDDPWDPPRPTLSSEAGKFVWAGWVARLGSGRGNLDKPTSHSNSQRASARSTAILEALDRLDATTVANAMPPAPFLIQEKLLAKAADLYARGLETRHGAVATVLAAASKLGKKRGQQWHGIVARTLAWKISGGCEFAKEAAAMFRALHDPVPPHREPLIASSRLPSETEETLAFSLDALQLLGIGGFLEQKDLAGLNRRMAQAPRRLLQRWLTVLHNRRGGRASFRNDARCAVAAAHLGMHRELASILRKAHARFAWRCRASNEHPHSTPRVETQDIRLWMLLAAFAKCAGLAPFLPAEDSTAAPDLWRYFLNRALNSEHDWVNDSGLRVIGGTGTRSPVFPQDLITAVWSFTLYGEVLRAEEDRLASRHA
jgi:hypothetical protein